MKRAIDPGLLQRLAAKLTYGFPMLESLLLIALIVGTVALPLIQALLEINKGLLAY